MRHGVAHYPTPRGDKEHPTPKLETAPMPMDMENEADEDHGFAWATKPGGYKVAVKAHKGSGTEPELTNSPAY